MEYAKNSFEYQNKIGKQGTLEVTQILKRFKDVISVINIEETKEFQPLGVDLMCTTNGKNGLATHYIEVKTDKHQFKNYALETISNDKTNTVGGFVSSKSHLIIFYFINEYQIHIIRTKELQAWFSSNEYRFKSVTIPTVNKTGERVFYNTICSIVPWSDVFNNVSVWICDLIDNSIYTTNKKCS